MEKEVNFQVKTCKRKKNVLTYNDVMIFVLYC